MKTQMPTQANNAARLSITAASSELLQRKCACGGGGASGLTGECEECNGKVLTIQRRAATTTGATSDERVPPRAHEASGSPAQPLAASARAESRLGHDFRNVSVIAGAHAAPSALTNNRPIARPLLPFASPSEDLLDAPPLQAKLVVGQPNDRYEQEADRVAERLVQASGVLPWSGVSPRSTGGAIVQRAATPTAAIKPAHVEGEPIDEEALEEELLNAVVTSVEGVGGEGEDGDDEEKNSGNAVTPVSEESAEKIQLKAAAAPASRTETSLDSEVEAARGGGGHPLPERLRGYFESQLGHDLSGVRVHTGERATQSARALNAHAYTVGRDIVFALGQYAPETTWGARLLAHELVHVIQQTGRPALQRQTRGPEGVSCLPKQKGFEFLRCPDGNLAVWELWQAGDTLDSYKRRAMTKYVQGRFSPLPLDVFANLLRHIFDHMTFTDKKGVDYSKIQPNDKKVLLVYWEGEQEIVREYNRLSRIVTPAPPPKAEKQETKQDEKKTEKDEKTPKAQHPLQADFKILEGADKVRVCHIYLKMMQHFGGLTVTAETLKLAEGGLSEDELRKQIIKEDKKLLALTAIFTQGYKEYLSFGGKEEGPFPAMIEALLEQVSFRNPTALRNQLAIGRGKHVLGQAPSPWGIYHRPSWLMYYDEFGTPVRSPAGGYADPGYNAVAKTADGINTEDIDDPVLKGFLTLLKQQIGDPDAVIAEGAKRLWANRQVVIDEVKKGLPQEVLDRFLQMLPVFVAFLFTRALANFMIRRGQVALGFALHVLLKGAELALEIEFYGSTIAMLEKAGYHFSRLEKTASGDFTELSQSHLVAGSVYLRKIVADVALMSAAKAFSAFLNGMKKEPFELTCNTCTIKSKGAGEIAETKALREYVKGKDADTSETFSAHEPVKVGQKEYGGNNTFEGIIALLKSKVAELKAEGKTPPDIKEGIIEEGAINVIQKDPALKAEYEALVDLSNGKDVPQYKSLDISPKRRAEIGEELSNLQVRKVKSMRPDLVEFWLKLKRVLIWDITLRIKDPWHEFKTKFYRHIMRSIMPSGFEVEAVDIKPSDTKKGAWPQHDVSEPVQ